MVDNPELDRYEVRVDGELVGFAQYRIQGERMTIFHVEVDAAHERRGIGSQLARDALADVRRRGLELVPRCPVVASYVQRNADLYLDLVPEPLREKLIAGASGAG